MTEFLEPTCAPAREAVGADVFGVTGEFSKSRKKGPTATARARGCDGKNPADGAAPGRLLEQGRPTPYQAPDRTPSVATLPPRGSPFAAPPSPPRAEFLDATAREGLTLGVDIGNAGGLALVTAEGALVDVAPMPVLVDGPKGRPTVNGPLLAAIVKRWAPSAAFIELVGPRPGEAAGGAFSFGRARGLVEGVLAAEGVPARMVTAPTWKRHCGIPAGRDGVKDMARAEACRRWPGMADRFAAKGSDGLAEAGLIAVAGMAREAQGR